LFSRRKANAGWRRDAEKKSAIGYSRSVICVAAFRLESQFKQPASITAVLRQIQGEKRLQIKGHSVRGLKPVRGM
jgi:hypothetical protein